MRWTRKSIIAEINRLHHAGEPLNYSAAEANHLNLVRAAAWHFGTWRHAIETAGIDYEGLSRYQRWDKKRIVERIQELHKEKQDLSWRSVSTQLDPSLAAAALRPNGFRSWREAVAAAGIDVDNVTRYKYWDNEKVIKAIRARKRQGQPMSSKSLQTSDQSLFCAARRRFGSWDSALDAAGLNAEKIRLRRHTPRLNAPRKKKADETPTTAQIAALNGKPAAPKTTAKNAAAPKSTPASKTAAPRAASTPRAAAKATTTAKTASGKSASKSSASKKSTTGQKAKSRR